MGTMPIRGAVSQSLAHNGSYTIPMGYHNGSGKVTQNMETRAAQTYTPGMADQTIPAGRFLTGAQTILGDANLIPSNIAKSKSIFGVTGTYEGGVNNSLIKELPITDGRHIPHDKIYTNFNPLLAFVIVKVFVATSPITSYNSPADIGYSSNKLITSSSYQASIYGKVLLSVRPIIESNGVKLTYITDISSSYDFYNQNLFNNNMPSNIPRYVANKAYIIIF